MFKPNTIALDRMRNLAQARILLMYLRRREVYKVFA